METISLMESLMKVTKNGIHLYLSTSPFSLALSLSLLMHSRENNPESNNIQHSHKYPLKCNSPKWILKLKFSSTPWVKESNATSTTSESHLYFLLSLRSCCFLFTLSIKIKWDCFDPKKYLKWHAVFSSP